jgi:hypothetical protein
MELSEPYGMEPPWRWPDRPAPSRCSHSFGTSTAKKHKLTERFRWAYADVGLVMRSNQE